MPTNAILVLASVSESLTKSRRSIKKKFNVAANTVVVHCYGKRQKENEKHKNKTNQLFPLCIAYGYIRIEDIRSQLPFKAAANFVDRHQLRF